MIDTPLTLAADAALDAWEADGLVELDLTNGRRVRVAPGSMAALLVTGLLPQPLVEAVLSGGTENRITDPRVGFELVGRSMALAAGAVRAVWHEGAWVPVALTVERYGRLPLADQVQISRVALGPELGGLGYDLGTFPDDLAGDAPGGNGAEVRPASVEPAGPNRATRRARPRPGPAHRPGKG